MIIAIIGNIGSGKSVSATKKVIDSTNHCFVNFNMTAKHTFFKKNIERVRKADIITEEIKTYKKDGTVKTKELKVNWDFWNASLIRLGGYHLFLDEISNIASSRQSLTKFNTLFSMWLSQVRKLLGDSETTNIYLITQKLTRMDVAFRDLLHCIIGVRKYEDTTQTIKTLCYSKGKLIYKMLPAIYIIQHYFVGSNCEQDFYSWENFNQKTYNYKTYFLANNYFKYYNSYEIFGETAYL